ncbi:hypothetical protein Glove_50g126 [Diversispora epigaea]|uniref:Uncharacterized protein n=1 Tax=Diversispora epigaea TaxID=1348612 RepID=A0A397JI57_9GLOM|nr:hypothetical protein Glove_50g126 [Diversispora epigaea]
MCGYGYHYKCYQILEKVRKGSQYSYPEENEGEEVLVEENEVIEKVEMNRSQEVYNKLLEALNWINT